MQVILAVSIFFNLIFIFIYYKDKIVIKKLKASIEHYSNKISEIHEDYRRSQIKTETQFSKNKRKAASEDDTIALLAMASSYDFETDNDFQRTNSPTTTITHQSDTSSYRNSNTNHSYSSYSNSSDSCSSSNYSSSSDSSSSSCSSD